MTEQPIQKLNRWAGIGQLVIVLADIVLVMSLWQARTTRLRRLADDVPFFSDNFGILVAVTIAIILISLLLIFTRRLEKIATVTLVWVWIVVSLVGLLLVSSFIAAFAFYDAPFLVWLIITDMGLLLIAYRDSLAKMNTKAVIRNSLAMIIGIFVTLLLLEMGLRVYFGILGTDAQKVAYIYSVDQILEATNRYAGRPYINYGLVATHPDHNSRAYRGAEFSIPKTEDTYRIFALGGSTTYGDSVLASEAYPAVLQRILQEEYGYTNIEVVNAGVNAYSSFDSLANLTYHVLDDEPDMVIVYHGVNDVRARLVDPAYYSGLNVQRGYWNPSSLQRRLSPSVLLRFISIHLGIIGNPNQFETLLGTNELAPRCGFFETVCSAVGNRPAAEIIAENPPIYFERNLRNIAAVARANDVDVVYSTWLYYAGELELPNPMMLAHMQDAVDEQNALLVEFAADIDVSVMDFARDDALDSPEYWIDGMHMTPLGTEAQARFYAAYLIEHGLLPPPVN